MKNGMLVLLVVLVAGGLVGGCGDSEEDGAEPAPDGAVAADDEAAETAALEWARALEDDDFEAACELNTAEFSEPIGPLDCEELMAGIATQVPTAPEATSVEVDGDTAEVGIAGTGYKPIVVMLVNENGEWKVDGRSGS